MRRAVASLLALALVAAVPTVAIAARKHPHAALTAVAISVTPDPITVGTEFTVTVSTDTAGWLHGTTPCVDAWVNVAPGTGTIPFAAPCAAGTVTLEITDFTGTPTAGPFTYTVEEPS